MKLRTLKKRRRRTKIAYERMIRAEMRRMLQTIPLHGEADRAITRWYQRKRLSR